MHMNRIVGNNQPYVEASGLRDISISGAVVKIQGLAEDQLLNISGMALPVVSSWFPRDLEAQKIVLFPDLCPTKAPLPTGTAVLTTMPDWRRFAISDCGCGMRLVNTEINIADFNEKDFDALGRIIQSNNGKLGDLGRGNHFLDAIVSNSNDKLSFLIHTGSLKESNLVDAYIDNPKVFDVKFDDTVRWAADNRATIASAIESIFGTCKLVLDLPHNTFEKIDDSSVIIRKGAVKALPGQLSIIPSTLDGDIALVEATKCVTESLHSLCHGTGRAMPRSEAKEIAETYDFKKLRSRVYIPEYIKDHSLRSEAPFAYRNLDECLTLMSDFVEVKERFSVIGYLGHL